MRFENFGMDFDGLLTITPFAKGDSKVAHRLECADVFFAQGLFLHLDDEYDYVQLVGMELEEMIMSLLKV